MADESDVENALAAACAAAIYPAGSGSPPAGGYPTRIYAGEPNANALDADLTAGIVNVAITLVDKMSRKTTRYTGQWQPLASPAPAITAALSGNVVTFAGLGGAGAMLGVQSAGVGYAYVTVAGDTPASVAAALAALIPGGAAQAATLTLPSTGGGIGLVIYAPTEAISELRRQEQGFCVNVMAPTPAARTAVASVVDAALAAIDFLTLADGSGGRLLYRRTRIDDVPSKANLWRRELLYTVEYGTTSTQFYPAMTLGIINLPAIQRTAGALQQAS